MVEKKNSWVQIFSKNKLSLPAKIAKILYYFCRRLLRFVFLPGNNFKEAVV